MKTFLALLLLALPLAAQPPASPAPSATASPAKTPPATPSPKPAQAAPKPAAVSATPAIPSATAAPTAQAPLAAVSAPPTPMPSPVPRNWKVLDAPYRLGVRFKAAPQLPEAGIAIEFPDNGQMRPDLADLLLTDFNGTPQPLAKIASRPGGRIILLARKLEPNTPYFLYFGGGKVRPSPDWSPKVSLLLETRPAPKDLKFDSLASLKTAWAQSPEAPGAGFVPVIYHGGNHFGPNANFLTRYSGYLNLPTARDITFYTLSSDCSFVIVNGQTEFGWPGQHPAHAEPNTVVKKTVSCPKGLVKIEYYAAKGANNSTARLGAATVLGWQKPDGTFEAIPQNIWLHPGTASVGPLQTRGGQFTPFPRATVQSYSAYGGQWFYETLFELRPPQVVKNGTAAWQFPDGALTTGTAFTRLLAGDDSQTLHCKFSRDGVTLDIPLRVDIPQSLHRDSVNNPAELRRYLDLIGAEATMKLNPAAARLRLAFLADFGTDREIARFAGEIVRTGDDDPLWIKAQLAKIHLQAQTAPAAARQALYTLASTLTPVTATSFSQELASAEIDLIVYVQRDPEGFGRLQQLAFINRENKELCRTLKIRIGDLHRLLGQTQEAVAEYQKLTPAKKDLSLAVKDSAASLAVRDLLEKGAARDAETKLLQWEQRRPMCKYDTDFLLMRARVWIAMGRWAEAKTELESFQKIQPESPFQLDARFYLARILFEQDHKDQARKIWTEFAKDYPRHPLAAPALQWAKKP